MVFSVVGKVEEVVPSSVKLLVAVFSFVSVDDIGAELLLVPVIVECRLALGVLVKLVGAELLLVSDKLREGESDFFLLSLEVSFGVADADGESVCVPLLLLRLGVMFGEVDKFGEKLRELVKVSVEESNCVTDLEGCNVCEAVVLGESFIEVIVYSALSVELKSKVIVAL